MWLGSFAILTEGPIYVASYNCNVNEDHENCLPQLKQEVQAQIMVRPYELTIV